MHLLRQLNIWCIDVAVSAGLLSFAFSRLWNIALPLSVPVLLSIAVWLIYTFDHLKDTVDTKEPGLSARRNLHRKYVKQLIAVSMMLLLLAAGLIFFVPVKVVVYGTALSLLVVSYYLGLHLAQRSPKLKKEYIVAILYTAGVVLGPLACGTPPAGYQLHVLQLFLLALNNLLLFSWFDREMDQKEGFSNIVHILGAGKIRLLLILLPLFQFMAALLLSASGFFREFELLWAMIGIVMLLPMIKPVYWQLRYRYRILGDFLFFVPSAIILFL